MDTDDRSRAAQVFSVAGMLLSIAALSLIYRGPKSVAYQSNTPPDEHHYPSGWFSDDPYKFPPNLRKEGFEITYSTQMAIVIEAFKLVGFANGGAAVALLAFIGAVAKPGIPAPNIVWPLILFTAGLVLCMLALFAAYLAQRGIRKYNLTEEMTPTAWHRLLYLTSGVFTACSTVSFVVGIILAGLAIASFGKQPDTNGLYVFRNCASAAPPCLALAGSGPSPLRGGQP